LTKRNPGGRPPTASGPETPDEGLVLLRLYIAGSTPNSQRAVANLKAALDEFAGRREFRVEHIDVLVDTQRAATDSVMITPTLVAVGAKSRVVLIGDLSDSKKLKDLLNAAAGYG
jgi:circadian clock protein KaiB